jgi:hypothetical protein
VRRAVERLHRQNVHADGFGDRFRLRITGAARFYILAEQ